VLTIFTTPKPFAGHIGIIQTNAIMSWTKLKCRPEIILIGNEPGTAQICKKLYLKHIPDVKTNSYGTPYCSDIFNKAQKMASHPINVYVNADVILTDSLSETALKYETTEHFLLIGRRHNLEVSDLINFDRKNWEMRLRKKVIRKGSIHNHTGIDYFVFRRLDWMEIPPLVIGRVAWDNWLVFQAIKKGHKVVNATKAIFVVHQTHNYKKADGGIAIQKGPEAIQNRKIADKDSNVHSGFITNAPWELTEKGELIRCRP